MKGGDYKVSEARSRNMSAIKSKNTRLKLLLENSTFKDIGSEYIEKIFRFA